MKRCISLFLLGIFIGILQGCGAGQTLTFEPVAKLNREKYDPEKFFYRTDSLKRGDQNKGFFWKLKTKI